MILLYSVLYGIERDEGIPYKRYIRRKERIQGYLQYNLIIVRRAREMNAF